MAVTEKGQVLTMLQQTTQAQQVFSAGTDVNQVAISGKVTQLTQFQTSQGSTMSLGTIEGVGNRGKVIIEFTAFIEPEVLKYAHQNGLNILLEGDLKMYRGKGADATWKVQIDVSNVTASLQVSEEINGQF